MDYIKNVASVLEMVEPVDGVIKISAEVRDLLVKLLREQQKVVRCKDCKHWDKTTREEGNDCISGPWEDAVCEVFRDWDVYGDLGENFRRTNGDWFCGDGEVRQDG